MKYNIGDIVVISKNKSFHNFKIGERVIITIIFNDCYAGNSLYGNLKDRCFDDSEIE